MGVLFAFTSLDCFLFFDLLILDVNLGFEIILFRCVVQ